MTSSTTPRVALSHRPKIVAHRGASGDAPENTMAAFELAWRQGADAIEGDIHLTADGQIVCMHDRSALRTGGVDQLLAEMTLAQVRRLDVGRWRGERFAGERVPTLGEVLASLPIGRQFLIEIKPGPHIIAALEQVLLTVRHRWEDLRIISFNQEVIAAAKAALPRIGAYWLTDLRPDESGMVRPTAEGVVAVLRESGADGVDARGEQGHISDAFAAQIKSAGYELHTWTIDDPDVARKLAGRGVDSITTNRPALMRAALTVSRG